MISFRVPCFNFDHKLNLIPVFRFFFSCLSFCPNSERLLPACTFVFLSFFTVGLLIEQVQANI